MSDEDLEIIPILEDIVVTGDLNKAVTGGIDAKHLDTIESFDALFNKTENNEDTDNTDVESVEEAFAIESTEEPSDVVEPDDEENIITDSLPFSTNELSADALMDDLFSSVANEITEDADDNETLESSENISNESNDTTQHSEDIIALEPTFIHKSVEIDNHNLDSEASLDAEDINEQEDISVENDINSDIDSETDSQAHVQPAPQIDISQLAERVVEEIMPALETQVRSLVLNSLEKHLLQSIQPNEDQINTNDEDV